MVREMLFSVLAAPADFGPVPSVEFGFNSQGVIIVNDDASATLTFSFDGVTTHGYLDPNDGSVSFDNFHVGKVWVKSTVPGSAARIWAWPRTT